MNPDVKSSGEASGEITKEQLINQVKKLTENQNSLIDTINSLNSRRSETFRIPDQIKIIPTFSGNRKETLAWVEDVDQTLEDLLEYELLETNYPLYKIQNYGRRQRSFDSFRQPKRVGGY